MPLLLKNLLSCQARPFPYFLKIGAAVRDERRTSTYYTLYLTSDERLKVRGVARLGASYERARGSTDKCLGSPHEIKRDNRACSGLQEAYSTI